MCMYGVYVHWVLVLLLAVVILVAMHGVFCCYSKFGSYGGTTAFSSLIMVEIIAADKF